MENETTSAIDKAKAADVAPLLPLPVELEAKGEKFTTIMEHGGDTAKALRDSDLTLEQAGIILARRPVLQKRIAAVREARVERRGLMVDAVENRAFAQVMGDVEETVVEEETTDRDGNPITKRKVQRRGVSHDNLTMKLLDLDAEHRKAKTGGDGASGAIVAVNVVFNGIDIEAFRRGNTPVVMDASQAAMDEHAAKVKKPGESSEEDAEMA